MTGRDRRHITIDIAEQLLTDLGREELEREFTKTIERLELRKRARQSVEGLKGIDLTNDPEHQKARKRAWKSYCLPHNLAPHGSRND